MEENKKTAPEVPVQEQAIQITVNVSNFNELEMLINELNEKLNQLKNFDFRICN